MSRSLYFWFHQQWGHLGNVTIIILVKQNKGLYTHYVNLYYRVFHQWEKKPTLQLIIHSYPQSTQTCTSPRAMWLSLSTQSLIKIRSNSYIILKTCVSLNLDFKQKQVKIPNYRYFLQYIYFCTTYVQTESVNIAHRQNIKLIP